MTIGQRIKTKRTELGLTQQQLADRLGKTKSAICRVEKDVEQNLTLDRVSEFAKALNCDESYLMGWDISDKKEYNKDEIEAFEKGITFASLFKNIELQDAIEKLGKLQPSDQEVVCNLINSLFEKVEK